MSCSFEIQLREDPTAYIAKAKSAIARVNGSFVGDEHAGVIEAQTIIGDIGARYTITADRVMKIEVLEKPMLLSCNKIKSVLEEYLG